MQEFWQILFHTIFTPQKSKNMINSYTILLSIYLTGEDIEPNTLIIVLNI